MKFPSVFFRLTLFLFSVFCISQNTVNYNQVSFNSCEVIEASLYDKSFTLYISEKDMQEAKAQDGTRMPESNVLSIAVEFLKGCPFPIEPKDSVMVGYSLMQQNKDEMDFERKQLNNVNVEKASEDGKRLNEKGKDVGTQAKIISQQLMEGKITAQEAEAKLEALLNPLVEAVEDTESIQYNSTQLPKKNTFDILFMDTRAYTRSLMFSGTIYIKKFNETEFEAVFQGNQFTECMENRPSISQEERQTCAAVPSYFMTEMKVLSNEPTKASVSVKLKSFTDYRE
ncbi:MAG: hypothetical protein CMC74_08530 [Flavobacteriaceae bacterium]|nr:hypothetical protein [Flavobacteriaceae bacterium]|tara:strand:+ start:44146 stop:44997 length:852 start_codon:yes stop_codon:yes gene_type:complete